MKMGSGSSNTNGEGDEVAAGDPPTDAAANAAPQSSGDDTKSGSTGGGSGATHDEDKTEEDVTIAALTEGLGSVSIAAQNKSGVDVPDDIRDVAELISSGKYKNIVVLTGAGVSCNAGIPDFRTPGTGLYDNLQKYNLPYPEAVFDIAFYRNDPDPFIQLASELWPGNHSPTVTHSFIALLEKKGMLLRNYTQNIDCLDVLAGVSEEKMIECHGHFRTASCIECSRSFDGKECKRIIVQESRVPECPECGGYVKPDIVFFGESLPTAFHRNVRRDTAKADLLIVMGTSLLVGPVNGIPEMVSKSVPRVLFNRELVGTFKKKVGPKTRRNSHVRQRDKFHGGDCDESIRMLCDLLGWGKELDSLNESTRRS